MAHPIHDHHTERDPYELGEWCWEHMVEKIECVLCQFGEDDLVFLHACPRCSAGDLSDKGIKTWGWRSPEGDVLCVRCMAFGYVQLLRTHELVDSRLIQPYHGGC